MRSISDDLAFAWRSLLGSRGTALAAVLTLALGTGANTAVLAVAYGVLLRPLPFAAPDRLVVIDMVRRPSNTQLGIKLADVEEWRRRLQDVDGLAAFSIADLTVRGAGEPDSVRSLLVTGDFFRVLGTPPAAGQPFTDSRAAAIDDALPADLDHVCVRQDSKVRRRVRLRLKVGIGKRSLHQKRFELRRGAGHGILPLAT